MGEWKKGGQVAEMDEVFETVVEHLCWGNWEKSGGKMVVKKWWPNIKRQEKNKVGKDVEKKEPSCTVGGNANCGKQYGGSSRSYK